MLGGNRVALARRALSPAESNYAQIDRDVGCAFRSAKISPLHVWSTDTSEAQDIFTNFVFANTVDD